jgi:hypothetical protein
MKMKTVPESKQWFRLWSVQAAAVSVVIALQAVLPLWEGIVSPSTFAILAAIVGTIGAIARQVKQDLPPPPAPKPKA